VYWEEILLKTKVQNRPEGTNRFINEELKETRIFIRRLLSEFHTIRNVEKHLSLDNSVRDRCIK